MAKINDGLQVQKLPEFQALMRRLGVLTPKHHLFLTPDTVEIDNKPIDGLAGTVLYHEQVFIDFCNVVAVDWNAETISIKFYFGEGERPVTVHRYGMRREEDMKPNTSQFVWMIPLAVFVGGFRFCIHGREVSWYEAYIDFAHIFIGMLFMAMGMTWKWKWVSVLTNLPFWLLVILTTIETIMFMAFKGLLLW